MAVGAGVDVRVAVDVAVGVRVGELVGVDVVVETEAGSAEFVAVAGVVGEAIWAA